MLLVLFINSPLPYFCSTQLLSVPKAHLAVSETKLSTDAASPSHCSFSAGAAKCGRSRLRKIKKQKKINKIVQKLEKAKRKHRRRSRRRSIYQ